MRMRLEDLVVALASHADDGSITDFTSYYGQILTRLALADRIGALHRYPPQYDVKDVAEIAVRPRAADGCVPPSAWQAAWSLSHERLVSVVLRCVCGQRVLCEACLLSPASHGNWHDSTTQLHRETTAVEGIAWVALGGTAWI